MEQRKSDIDTGDGNVVNVNSNGLSYSFDFSSQVDQNPSSTMVEVLDNSNVGNVQPAVNSVQPSVMPAPADAVTSATPLGVMSEGGIEAAQNQFTTMQMFLGQTGGSMGEVCALALLIGGIFLIVMKVISAATPVAFLGTIAVVSVIAGADPVWQICAGGAMLGAFFMATDYATTPTTTLGKVIFGIGCGLITMLIRLFGSYPEGVSFSILLMNIMTPHIDTICEKRLYGSAKKAKKGGAQ